MASTKPAPPETITIYGKTYDLSAMPENQRQFFDSLAASGLVPTTAALEEIEAINWNSIFSVVIEPFQKTAGNEPQTDKAANPPRDTKNSGNAVWSGQECKNKGLLALMQHTAERKRKKAIRLAVEAMIYSERPCRQREARANGIAELLAEYGNRFPSPGETSRDYLAYLREERNQRKRSEWVRELTANGYADRPQLPGETLKEYAQYLRKRRAEVNRRG